MVEAAETNRDMLTVTDLATHVNVSVRSLHRLAGKYVGPSPAALIRRRRLQEAAERLRQESDLDLATVANACGYADHAHFTNDFRDSLGLTPSEYRRSLS